MMWTNSIAHKYTTQWTWMNSICAFISLSLQTSMKNTHTLFFLLFDTRMLYVFRQKLNALPFRLSNSAEFCVLFNTFLLSLAMHHIHKPTKKTYRLHVFFNLNKRELTKIMEKTSWARMIAKKKKKIKYYFSKLLNVWANRKHHHVRLLICLHFIYIGQILLSCFLFICIVFYDCYTNYTVWIVFGLQIPKMLR